MRLVTREFGLAIDGVDGGPLPIGYITCIGQNYAAHAREQGLEPPDRLVVFTKSPVSACLSGSDIVVPRICQDRPQVDFEGELGVVIGKGVRDVSCERAMDHVMGFVVANDVSARWWQKQGAGGQFCRGKSFDTFCPLSPEVVSPSVVGDGSSLRITTRVNGEVMQDGTTDQMIFDVPTLISELSRGTTLAPGTLILTGTPSGVGMSREPPVFLTDGDQVEVEIGRVGVVRSRVRYE